MPSLLATQYRTFPYEVVVVDKWQVPGFRYAACGGYSISGAGVVSIRELRSLLNHRGGRLVVAHFGGDDAAAHLVYGEACVSAKVAGACGLGHLAAQVDHLTHPTHEIAGRERRIAQHFREFLPARPTPHR